MTFRDSATMSKGPCICDPGPAGLRLVVIDRSTQYIAGMVSILDNSPMDLRCRVGDFWLTPAFQRTHLATAVMLALLSHLLGPPMRCRRIEWHCDNRWSVTQVCGAVRVRAGRSAAQAPCRRAGLQCGHGRVCDDQQRLARWRRAGRPRGQKQNHRRSTESPRRRGRWRP